jgi:Pregnancy-associated plasma protein-A
VRGASSSFAFRAAPCLLAVVSIAGCGATVAAPDDSSTSGASVTFGPEGVTSPVLVPAFTGEALALHARTQPGTCFALTSLEDESGREWVGSRAAGPFCADCPVRTSLAQGEALFVLARDGAFSPARGLSLAFGLLRCDTLTPLRTGPVEPLELSWFPREGLSARGSLQLRFLVSEHSMLKGRADLVSELMSRLQGELDGADLQVQLEEVIALAGVAAEATFSSTELTALEAMLAAVPQRASTVDVVFAGCLRYDDLLGPPSAVDGFTPRVVGGAGPASAIFMPGRRCDGFSDAPATFRVEPYARVLAHELGHYLGLYHTVEADGTDDLFTDTTDANIMNHNPSLAAARGFSPAQARQMRLHPSVAVLSR